MRSNEHATHFRSVSHKGKLDRASEQIAEIRTLASAYLASHPFKTAQAPESNSLDRILVIELDHPVPEKLSIRIGEALHNLRGALDHLVWQFAPVGARSKRLEFPIFLNAAEFDTKGRPKIRLLSKRAQATVERLQPYRAEGDPSQHPLWLLHELNNTDKHRHLVEAIAECGPSSLVSMAVKPAGPAGEYSFEQTRFSDGKTVVRIRMPPEAYGAAMRVEMMTHYDVVFRHDGPAPGRSLGVLRDIYRHILDVVFPAFATPISLGDGTDM